MIENNHVTVSLVDTDEKVFASLLSGSPIQTVVRSEDLDCTILYADKPLLGFVPSGDVHHAVITGAQIWYDSVLKMKDLVITLDAPSLIDRHIELCRTYQVNSMYEDYFPHMTLVYNLPDFASSYKWWINNILNDFNGSYKGTILRFDNESIESTSSGIYKSGRIETDDVRINRIK